VSKRQPGSARDEDGNHGGSGDSHGYSGCAGGAARERKSGEYETRITGRRWITGDTLLLDIERPPEFQFLAGQRVEITVEGVGRDYSLIPGNSGNTLTLLIRRIPRGALTTLLGDCPVGTRLCLSGPGGHFIYRQADRQAVFIATGTGVAPFAAMCSEGVTGMIFLHGARLAQELYFRETFETAADHYVACVSGLAPGPRPPARPGVYPGRVTGYLREQLQPGDYDFYLAGSGEMIADAIEIIDNRFPTSRVYSEIFY
jgi:ferredoxin-NADP reductase